ncbi:MAG: hypothetical protein Q7K43_04795 [Candidatus Woesearchaeota archaeon]|nr:hypothetical protein [Candidatus Woesearchaeota archaeon]
MKTFKKSKAQMEIMGLAIIIILVILAILFSIQFIKDDTSSARSLPDSLIANMFVNTYLETTILACNNIRLKELIKDCSQGSSTVCADGMAACQKAKSTSTEITNTYFGIIKRNYNLLIKGSPELSNSLSQQHCTGERESSKPFIIPARAGTTITVRLEVCKR